MPSAYERKEYAAAMAVDKTLPVFYYMNLLIKPQFNYCDLQFRYCELLYGYT
jgi:hypothetical protein